MLTLVKEKLKSEKYFPLVLMVCYWLLLGLIDLIKMVSAKINDLQNFDIYGNLSFVFIYSSVWILLTFPIYKSYSEFLNKKNYIRVISQFFFGVVFSSIHVVALSFLFSLTLYSPAEHGDSFLSFYSPRLINNFPRTVVNSYTVYWVVILILFAFDYYKKFREKANQALKLESQLTQSQLQALRTQLQPHFLFNAHNTISMLIRTAKYNKAVNIISKLSDLLRSSLSVEDEQLVTLETELELLNKYLEIEKARFDENLEVTINIDENVKDYLVPNLILQPIVENAFKHGISKVIGKNILEITCYKENENIILKVYNTGPRLKDNFKIDENNGVGLMNTQERLSQLYDDNYDFELINYDKGVLVTIQLPAK